MKITRTGSREGERRILLLLTVVGVLGLVFLYRPIVDGVVNNSFYQQQQQNQQQRGGADKPELMIQQQQQPKSILPLFQRRFCENEVMRTITESERAKLAKAIDRYVSFSSHDYYQRLSKALDREKLKRPGTWEPCTIPGDCQHAEFFGWSGLAKHDHERFDYMGDQLITCPQIKAFGRDDEEKRFCWSSAFDTAPICNVFSIGSKNWYEFEKDFLAKVQNKNCHIHIFDCTIDFEVPPQIKHRVSTYKLCLGDHSNGPLFRSYDELLKEANVNRVTLLKMDIEGFEWEVLLSMLNAKLDSELPDQIAFELHYLLFTDVQGISWERRDRSPGEIFMFFQHLMLQGGYVLAERRDNSQCKHCSEALLVKALCKPE